MQNLKRETEENLRRLSENPYPGRGIVVGRSSGGKLLQFYWIMGRSENSRNRIFTRDHGDLHTAPKDKTKVEDPSLIIYRGMAEVGRHFLVSNGAHTETLVETIQKGGGYQEALRKHQHEPDAPHLTPRLAGGISLVGENPLAWLAILRANRFADGSSDRFFYEFSDPPAGFGWCITTYRGDGTPLPPFAGEPFPLPLQGEGDALLPWVWNRLNEPNRISIALKIIDPVTGNSEIKITNKY